MSQRRPLRLKQLECVLQQADGFRRPKLPLEQYVTPPHIAAQLVQWARDDLADRVVCDLGCGPGVLALGAAAVGATHVIAVDIDVDALAVAADNVERLAAPGAVQLVCADATQLPALWRGRVDTVLTNPPFGTKHNSGADVAFVRAALQLASRVVYSLHKRATRPYIVRRAAEWRCRRAEVVAELRYDLPSTYRFHKKASVDIDVDLWRLCPPAELHADLATLAL